MDAPASKADSIAGPAAPKSACLPATSAAASFSADRDGAAAIEFALISTVLLAMFAAGLDLSYMVDAQRDVERASTLMVKTLSSCPAAAEVKPYTWKGSSDCVTDTIIKLRDALPNVLVTFPSASYDAVPFRRDGNTIVMCRGTLAALTSNMQTSALALLKDQDAAAVVSLSVTYIPFFPLLSTFATTGNTYFKQYTIDVQGNGDPYKC